MKLWYDSEVYSDIPLREGGYKYAEGCRILLITYALDDDPVKVVDIHSGEAFPEELTAALKNPDVDVWAHNSMFDRIVLRHCYPDICPPVERWRDTMVQAYSHSLPGALADVCILMGVAADGMGKKDGSALVRMFCIPASRTFRRPEEAPAEWAAFREYATYDIVAMREAHKRMPTVNYPDNKVELSLWHLDQRINDRGFRVDLDLVHAAIAASDRIKNKAQRDIQKATAGAVEAATQRDALMDFIFCSYGIAMPDLTKATVTALIDNEDIPEPVRYLLQVRQRASASSISKYKALSRATCEDHRCHGTIQFCGAKRTGRAAGRVFQPQNLPSRGLLEESEVDFGIASLIDGTAETIHGDMTRLLVSTVRSVLQAPKGKRLIVADLANIEGRVAAWLSGEKWKLKAFEDFDKGIGEDLYKLAYAKAFRVPVDKVTKSERAIGKVMELMLQYEGGAGAFATGALGYGFDLDDLAKTTWATLPVGVREEAAGLYEWFTKKKIVKGMSRDAFIVTDSLKRLWRRANPNIAAFWPALKQAVIRAAGNPERAFACGEHLRIKVNRGYLCIRLPSGRILIYPSIQEEEGVISYEGDNPFTHKWGRVKTFGGKLLENITQALSRDILYHAMPRAEENGFEIVLHVHDELVTETNIGNELTADALCEILSAVPTWAEGLPLAAAGFETDRYKK